MPRVGLEEVTSPASAQSVAKSTVFPRNWATLTLLPWVVFPCPWIEATPITLYLAPGMLEWNI